VNRGERRALHHYEARGFRLVDANVRVGRYELDLVLRRGRTLLVVEVKEKSGEAYGHPFEMIDAEKARRVHSAAWAWYATHPESAGMELVVEAAAVRGSHVECVPLDVGG
jgi:putative endonuclease